MATAAPRTPSGPPQQHVQQHVKQQQQQQQHMKPARARKASGEGWVQEVVVDEQACVQVHRNVGEDCSRVVTVSGFPDDGPLRPGMFLVGARLGTARVSFVKMPNGLVEQELERLRTVKKGYSLLVADRLHPSEAPPQQNGRELVPVTPVRNNPQDMTPKPMARSAPRASRPPPAAAALFAAPQASKTPGPPQRPRTASTRHGQSGHEESLAAMMQWTDLGKIQQSLEKLRGQRAAMERLKGELEKRDHRIRGLLKLNDGLRTQLESAQETVDMQARVFGDLQVADEKVKALEQRLGERDAQIVAARKSAAATEDFLRSSLEQEKHLKEEARTEHARAEEILRERVRELEARCRGEEQRAGQLEVELESAQSRLDEAVENAEAARAQQAERYSALGRQLEGVQAERDDLAMRVKSIEAEGLAREAALKSCRDALSAAEQRTSLLVGTVEELEDNAVVLRKQLLETEQRSGKRTQELQERLEAADKQLGLKMAELAELARKYEAAQESLHRAAGSNQDARAALARKSKEVENLEQAFRRGSGQLRTAETRYEQANAKMEALHEALLEERARNASLEQQLETERRTCREWAAQRMDLLEQFCEEEQRMRNLM